MIPVRFADSRVVPDVVFANTGPSRYEILLEGFEAGLDGLSIATIERMDFFAGGDCVSVVDPPVLDLGSTGHAVRWSMHERGNGLVIADIWFSLSSGEPIALRWELLIKR